MLGRSWCISYENRVGHEQILYHADQNFWTKKFSYLIFFSPEDKFRGHFNLWRRIQCVLKSVIWQMDIKLKHKEQSIKNYYFQVSFVYVK